MKSIVVSIRLPKEIIVKLKKGDKKVSEIIKEIIFNYIKENDKRITKKLKKIGEIEIIKGRKKKVSVAELIREDRDVLH